MKNQILVLLIFFALFTYQCSSEFGTINLESNISIDLPIDFVLEDNNPSSYETIYKAKSNADELYILVQTLEGIDSLTTEQKEQMLTSNLEGFVTSINGKNVQKQNMKTIDSSFQNEYSMEIEKKGSLTAVFAKIINNNSTIIILSYFTPQPTERESLELKDKIFKSLKIN